MIRVRGEEEGRSNRDLIEWLPGKLVYSRFLLTTCRRLLAMPNDVECADVEEIRWAYCSTTNSALYMWIVQYACSCYVRIMESLTLQCMYQQHQLNCRDEPRKNIKMKMNTRLKGKLGEFFLLAQSFYRLQTKRSVNRQISPKSPEVGQKSS